MDTIQAYCEQRLQKILIRDKENNPQRVSSVLRSEILYVLKNYLELIDNDIDIVITITKNGRYRINIQSDFRNIKSISYIQ